MVDLIDPNAFAEGYSRQLRKMVQHHLCDGLDQHVRVGRPTGDFLTAFLEGNLYEAIERADPASLAGFRGLSHFLHNYCPRDSFGSVEKVAAWRKAGGLEGRVRARAAP